MATLSRYAAIYGIMLRNSLIREMSFKANFLLWMLVDCFWFLGQILFIKVIFGYTENIGDWTQWEVVLLVATHQIISELFQAVFFMNVSGIPELVRTGKLDSILQLPADTQFLVSVKQFGLDNLVNALIGTGFAAFALSQLGLVPSFSQWCLYGALVVLGIAIHYSVLFFLATGSFWLVRAQGLVYGYYNVFNIARFPDVIFGGAFRFVFSWVIPVVLVANVPTRVLARAAETPWPLILQMLVVTVGLLIATRLFWKKALNRYSSASS